VIILPLIQLQAIWRGSLVRLCSTDLKLATIYFRPESRDVASTNTAAFSRISCSNPSGKASWRGGREERVSTHLEGHCISGTLDLPAQRLAEDTSSFLPMPQLMSSHLISRLEISSLQSTFGKDEKYVVDTGRAIFAAEALSAGNEALKKISVETASKDVDNGNKADNLSDVLLRVSRELIGARAMLAGDTFI
jgi:hypothetical protein